MKRLPLALSLLVLPFYAAAAPAWVEESNEHAQVFIDVLGEFQPEVLSYFGIEGFDDQVTDFGPDNPTRFRNALSIARDELQRRHDREENPLVREDLAIMIRSANETIDTSLIEEAHLVPFTNAGRNMFQGLFVLLQPDVPAARKRLALDRLRAYVGLAPNSTPLTTSIRARYEEAMADGSKLPPFQGEVAEAVANTGRFVAGLRDGFSGDDWNAADVDPALDALEAQLEDYEAWVRETVMPAARDNHQLPAAVYAQNLIGFGLDIAPEELMERAQQAFTEIRNEMQTLAALIAKERGWTVTDYRDVIRELKKEQLAPDEVIPFYRDIIAQAEDIIRRERIVTLPERDMVIRLASEAETASQPAPHMDPPPLTGDSDEPGVFVLTAGVPTTEGEAPAGYDDFTFAAGTWTLTAHEGRPGHELQFTAMVERGVSLARSFFAFNSVNVEGWALYAEAELKPYEPLEGQLIALQHRLLRASRAFLDPMLNLGLATPDDARRVLSEDVVLSEAMVTQEVDRYTFRAPGQATSYFYGYIRLMALRAATEVALGERFDRLAFNDFVIGQGLLPPELLATAVRNDFIPSQQ